MAGQLPPSPENESRLASLTNLVPDSLKTPFAVLSSSAALFGSAAIVHTFARNGVASAQEISSTSDPRGSGEGGSFNDVDVRDCQSLAVDPGNHNGANMIASRNIKYKLNRKNVLVKEGLHRLDTWADATVWRFACSEVTKNYVTLELVQKNTHGNISKIAKRHIIHGNNSLTYDGHEPFQVVRVGKKLSLPRKLTKADVKRHRFGIKDTITSEPLIQVPYIDTANPDSSIPGPMQILHSKSHITWIGATKHKKT